LVEIPVGMSLDRRRRQPELMDQPGLDEVAHAQALRGLERINSWSGSVRILWPAIRGLLQENKGRPVRILDLASGAGDVPIGLWIKAIDAGFAVDIEGWDVNAFAVNYARERARRRRADVRFEEKNALEAMIAGTYDVIISSLFLHHLDEADAVELIRRMARAAARLVLINDLRRCAPGFWAAYVGTRLLSTSHIVHTDGPRSVEGAFSLAEVEALAQRAGLRGATVVRRWPFRFLLTWTPS
jgi:2-polyprenyl-3-methyl-5-hydroxy-6-metoxy-1,4-benzoquinol methylase